MKRDGKKVTERVSSQGQLGRILLSHYTATKEAKDPANWISELMSRVSSSTNAGEGVPKRGGNKERHWNGECFYARHTVRKLLAQCAGRQCWLF
jgi:hypothetical protein